MKFFVVEKDFFSAISDVFPDMTGKSTREAEYMSKETRYSEPFVEISQNDIEKLLEISDTTYLRNYVGMYIFRYDSNCRDKYCDFRISLLKSNGYSSNISVVVDIADLEEVKKMLTKNSFYVYGNTFFSRNITDIVVGKLSYSVVFKHKLFPNTSRYNIRQDNENILVEILDKIKEEKLLSETKIKKVAKKILDNIEARKNFKIGAFGFNMSQNKFTIQPFLDDSLSGFSNYRFSKSELMDKIVSFVKDENTLCFDGIYINAKCLTQAIIKKEGEALRISFKNKDFSVRISAEDFNSYSEKLIEILGIERFNAWKLLIELGVGSELLEE